MESKGKGYTPRTSSRTPRCKPQQVHADDHWMRHQLVSLSNHPTFGRSVVAARDLLLSPFCRRKIAHKRIFECTPVASLESARPIAIGDAENASPEGARYVITVDATSAFDLSTVWLGMINHAPPRLANVVVIGTRLFQTKDIFEGDHITYDYGVDYWVYQLTHLEKSRWDKRERRIWKKVHTLVEDWSPLMRMQLQDLVPFDIMRRVSEYYALVLKPLERARLLLSSRCADEMSGDCSAAALAAVFPIADPPEDQDLATGPSSFIGALALPASRNQEASGARQQDGMTGIPESKSVRFADHLAGGKGEEDKTVENVTEQMQRSLTLSKHWW